MDAYIYCADIYCTDCAREIVERLTRANPLSEQFGSTEDYPQGPYADGGGEADCPQHCGSCGVFLHNPLTPDGYEYVLHELQALAEWREEYGDDHFREPPTTINEILS